MRNFTGTSRRSFIKRALGAGVTLAAGEAIGCAAGERGAPAAVAAAQDPPDKQEPEEKPTPTEKSPYSDLRVAFIAVGGMGGAHVKEMVDLGVTCTCFADVDTRHWGNATKHWPAAKGYQDYREMFDKEARNFDAVMIATPDHHHYPATILAMQAGKHVYTQKPLTHTVWEARQLTEAAKKYKVVTQMGNQGHAGEGWRKVYEWIRSGAIGHVKETHTWTDRPIWPQGMERPQDEDPVPSTLNWDVWIGPAPMRPYKKDCYHQFAWRGWWDFGAGALGDMACHTMDGFFWALDPGHPVSVEPITASLVTKEAFPKASMIRWDFAGKLGKPALKAFWYDGGLMPQLPKDLELGRSLKSTGNLFIGTKGSLLVSGDYGEGPRVIPESRMKQVGKPKELLPRSPGHYKEWVMACVGEKPADFARSNFSYAGPMTETILLGNIALRVGRKLEWDGKKMQFTNLPEANQYITKEYRSGWKF